MTGISAFGQPTSTLLAATAAAGVALAGVVLVRVSRIPLSARCGVAAAATYGVVAFVRGAAIGTPLPELLHGESVWQRMPLVLQGAVVGGLVVLPLAFLVSIARTGLRRPDPESPRGTFRECVALATSLAIVVAAMPLPAGSHGASPTSRLASWLATPTGTASRDPAALTDALASSLRAIEDGERGSSRDRWDPAYVVDRLGRDPARLFAWVRNNTFWIPYRGLLRGPVGVLMDRLGNSLDRATLLATLLRQAGHSVRLAHGVLTDEQALKILPTLLVARVVASRPRVPSARKASNQLPAFAAQYHLDEVGLQQTIGAEVDRGQRVRAQLAARVSDQTRRLSEALGKRTDGNDRKRLQSAVEALKDHWWVQRQEGQTWVDLDPLASVGNPSATLVAPSETVELDGVSDELRHQVVIRVVAEQWTEGALAEHTALEHALRPAELIGIPVVLNFVPTDRQLEFPPAGSDPKMALRSTALAQHQWVPMLQIGSDRVMRKSVRDTGEVSDQAAANPAANLGNGTAKAFGSLFGAGEPSKPEAPESKSILTAAWIEYEIHTPNESPRTIRRAVFDLLGPTARAGRPVLQPSLDDARRLTRSLALMMETEILPVVCRIAPELVVHLTAEGLLANRDLLGTVVRDDLPQDAARMKDVVQRLVPMPSSLYTLALARFEWSRVNDQIYVDRPNILTRHVFFSFSEPNTFVLRQAMDIVANEIGVDLGARDSFAARLEQGVLDTNAEVLVQFSGTTVSNTAEAFATAGSRDAWPTLASAQDAQFASLRLPDDTRRRIADDLAGGYVVVAPTAPIPIGQEAFVGWWRVDPGSGQTLGVGSSGWGQALVEFAFLLSAGVLGFFFAYIWCLMMEGSRGTSVARACAPATPPVHRVQVLDYFVAPVEAAGGSRCFRQAIVAGVFGFFLAALVAASAIIWGAALAIFGGAAGAGAARMVSIDPLAPTQPGPPPETPPVDVNAPTLPGGPPALSPSEPPAPPPNEPPAPPGGRGPFHGDPVGRQLIADNPNSDATEIMGGKDYLNSLFNGADHAADSAYNGALKSGMGDEAAYKFSQNAWNQYIQHWQAPAFGPGIPNPGPLDANPFGATSPAAPISPNATTLGGMTGVSNALNPPGKP